LHRRVVRSILTVPAFPACSLAPISRGFGAHVGPQAV
jgi:hypothetical protein